MWPPSPCVLRVLAVELFAGSILPVPRSLEDWYETNLPIPHVLVDGSRMYKHGAGCAVHLPGGAVDFDFGASGEITGFNTNRLLSFARTSLRDYGFLDGDQLRQAVATGIRSGYILDRGEVSLYLSDTELGREVARRRFVAFTLTNAEAPPLRVVIEPWADQDRKSVG